MNGLQWLVAVAVTVAIGAFALHHIGPAEIKNDASQNLQMALNLSHHATISLDTAAPYRPSMYREPLPILADAIAVSMLDLELGRTEPRAYFSGVRARLLKGPNILWLGVLALAVFAATRAFTGSFWIALAAAALSLKPFLDESNLDTLNTDLPAAALLALVSLAVVRAMFHGRRPQALAAGAGFGLLALTKAAALYVGCGVVLALLVGHYAGIAELRGPRFRLQLALLVGSFLIVVAPWIARNAGTFGRAQITERGGLAVYTRGLMDQMTPTEYRGTFYVWARPRLQHTLGALLGFGPGDLHLGGRLQRLNEDLGSQVDALGLAAENAGRPEAAPSFWRQGRAQREKLESEFERRGEPYPDVAADRVMQEQGLQMVMRHFARNLALSVPLLWRGGPLSFVALLLALAYSVQARRPAFALFLLPALGMLLFYALFSDLLPRYGLLAQPTAVAGILIALCAFGARRASFEHASASAHHAKAPTIVRDPR